MSDVCLASFSRVESASIVMCGEINSYSLGSFGVCTFSTVAEPSFREIAFKLSISLVSWPGKVGSGSESCMKRFCA
jgi:hypothetical protein